MTEAMVFTIAEQAITVILLVAGPILLATLVVGSLISLVQAATQINEATLTFIPKIVVVVLIMVILGSWMLQKLMTFTSNLFTMLPNLVH